MIWFTWYRCEKYARLLAYTGLAHFSPCYCIMNLGIQVALLFVLAIPIACISWTVTHEEVFREPREYFVRMNKNGKNIITRKFFYLLMCEYCFSHYITIALLIITNFKMVFEDWRGYLISGFSLVWIANVYMSLYALLRTDLKKEKLIAEEKEEKLDKTN
jgi:hypothetical protein